MSGAPTTSLPLRTSLETLKRDIEDLLGRYIRALNPQSMSATLVKIQECIAELPLDFIIENDNPKFLTQLMMGKLLLIESLTKRWIQDEARKTPEDQDVSKKTNIENALTRFYLFFILSQFPALFAGEKSKKKPFHDLFLSAEGRYFNAPSEVRLKTLEELFMIVLLPLQTVINFFELEMMMLLKLIMGEKPLARFLEEDKDSFEFEITNLLKALEDLNKFAPPHPSVLHRGALGKASGGASAGAGGPTVAPPGSINKKIGRPSEEASRAFF